MRTSENYVLKNTINSIPLPSNICKIMGRGSLWKVSRHEPIITADVYSRKYLWIMDATNNNNNKGKKSFP